MGSYWLAAAAGGYTGNPNRRVTSGSADVTTGASAHTKGGSWTDILSAVPYDCYGIQFQCSDATNGLFYLMDISLDGGATIHFPNLGFQSSAAVAALVPLLELNIASGQKVSVKLQCSSALQTAKISAVAHERVAGDPVGYASALAISSVSTATSRVSGSDLTTSDTYQSIDSSTDAAFGAILVVAQASTTNPAAEDIPITVKNNTTAEVIGFGLARGTASVTGIPNGFIPLIRRAVPIANDLQVKATFTATFRIGAWGLVSA